MSRDMGTPGRRSPSLSPPSDLRISAKARKAIELIATEGRTQRDAAERAGMHEKALSRALKRPGVSEYLEQRKALFCQEIDSLRAQAKRVAILTALDLMENAKSEAVRMRAVEFFAGEAKPGTSVTVNVGAKTSGYEYIPPGAQVIDITPTTDTESVGQGEEGKE